ncbi:MAG: hypothetical protein HYY18_01065 [Planctomycetes bacterium]|nr:hypothetical protein [Planctomycetota bacterium]
MHRFLTFVLTALIAASALAETKKPGRTVSDDPRPGMRWIDAEPALGGRKLTLKSAAGEAAFTELKPGKRVELKVDGPTRVLVYSRLDFKSRTSKPGGYSWFWKLGDGPEVKAGFKGRPHRTATWKETSKTLPGTQDVLVIDVPADGAQTLVFSLPAAKKSDVAFRFLVEQPKPVKGGEARDETWHFGSTYYFRIGYDDNIWRFGDGAVHELEENDKSDRFNNIQRVEDWYMIDRIDLNVWNRTPMGRFTVGAEISDKLHLENHRRNVDSLGMSVKHQFAKNALYKVYASWSPDHFVRNFDSADIPGSDRSEAHYDDYRYGMRFWYRWSPLLSTLVQYEWQLKDYNTKFDERDLFLHHWTAGVRFKACEEFWLDFDWTHTHARARAHGDEIDGSYRENSPRLALDFSYVGILAGISYRYEWREYTTRNSGAIDPSHADRWDRRHVWKFMVGYQANETTAFKLEYTRTKKTSRIAGKQSSGDPLDIDEGLEYDANTWEFTIEYKFR